MSTIGFRAALAVGLLATSAAWAQAEKLDVHAGRVAEGGPVGGAGGRFAPGAMRGGVMRVDVFIDVDQDFAALPAIRALGGEVRTVLPTGLLTASVPAAALHGLAAVPGVRRIEAARRVEKRMNVATGPTGLNLPLPGDPLARTGAGVVVGVLDTGIDIAHPDFQGRIKAIWDHTLDPADVGGAAPSPSFGYGTVWSPAQIAGGYATCAHRDLDGHGTHVAGTSAGAGAAPLDPSAGDAPEGYRGVAPQADLVVVKFDFDNVKNRNTDAAMVDGVNWIFQQAAALGKPAVINMSLGMDYGPHDGTLGDERGIDALTGPGKVVVVAAGNAGRSYASQNRATWGAPLHGQVVAGSGTDEISIAVPAYAAATGSDNDYLFLDVWYPQGTTNRVQITSPSGKKYPSSFSGPNRTTCQTGGGAGSWVTPEGSIYCSNKAGTAAGWDTSSPDNNLYIEISDAVGGAPASGTWTIDVIPVAGSGVLHGWNGTSSSLNLAEFRFGGALTDSAMTIGAPGTAKTVISVGAYQTKDCWAARSYVTPTDPGSAWSPVTQCYGVAPISYYDPMTVGDLAFFSSRGPSRDGRTQPVVSAPGVGIVAALSQASLLDAAGGLYYRRLNRVSPTGYYATLQGTSMATPQVTGAVALLLEQSVAEGGATDPAAMRTLLAAGARKDAFTGPAVNQDWGHGKADVAASLALVEPLPNQAPIANAGPDQTVADADDSGDEGFTLSGAGSSDPDGAIVSWAWTDGVNTWTTQSFTVSRPVGGPYVYTLTVTDDEGATATDTVQVTVRSATDAVTISKASYSNRRGTLTVEATSSAKPDAQLTASWGTGSAPMAWSASKGRYLLSIAVSPAPASVTVTSSMGGSATRAVAVGN